MRRGFRSPRDEMRSSIDWFCKARDGRGREALRRFCAGPGSGRITLVGKGPFNLAVHKWK